MADEVYWNVLHNMWDTFDMRLTAIKFLKACSVPYRTAAPLCGAPLQLRDLQRWISPVLLQPRWHPWR